MAQRAAGLVIAGLGVLVVGLLILAGVDLVRASRTGPGWKRKLVTAGLLLLGLTTAPGCPPLFTTCYSMVPPARAAQRSVDHVATQIDLLDRLAASEKLDPAVVRKTLESVEQDLAVLESEEQIDQLPESKRGEARVVRARARADVEVLKARLKESPRESRQPAVAPGRLSGNPSAPQESKDP